MAAVHWSVLVAACVAYGVSVLFFPALRISSRGRVIVLVPLAVVVLLTPWIIPSEARIARFLVAIYSGVLVLKLWDLHLGAERKVRPSLLGFLGFLANLPSLVHRRIGSEPQPTRRENSVRLVKSLAEASLALLVLNLLNWLDWDWTTFLVEHL
ncbi:MAG: hypothetical protein HKO65_14145, partial [Gemmatimonadetes bacterium]|nr:hypothetical protein [Gemmatimonadota bacterium]